jgi:hypothetical protein
MDLAEIYVALPQNVALQLEELLNQVKLPKDPTRDEVLKASTELATELRFSVGYAGDDKVLDLIDRLPEAITNQLF